MTATLGAKGQLILKGNFSVFNSPKMNLKMLIFAQRAENFRSSFGRIEKTKKLF